MPTLNISLPDAMRVWIDAQVAAGGYSTASEYLRELVRTDQRRKVQERIEALLVEGIESGEPIEMDDAFWRRRRAQLRGQSAKASRKRR